MKADQDAGQEAAYRRYEYECEETEDYEAECEELEHSSAEIQGQEASYIKERADYERDQAKLDEIEYVWGRSEQERVQREEYQLQRDEYEWPYCGEEEPRESPICFDCGTLLAHQEEVLAGHSSSDTDETMEAPPYFGDVTRSSHCPTPVRLDGKYGYIDANGILVIPATYDDACLFTEEDHALVRAHGVWSLIDTCGNAAEPAPWEDDAFDIHLRLVEVEDEWYYKWGYEWDYKIVLPAIYDDARSFSDGRAAVCIADKWGYIDSNGYMVIPATYNDANPFRNGRAAVRVGTKWTYVDLAGNEQGLATQTEAEHAQKDAGREAAMETARQKENDRESLAASRDYDRESRAAYCDYIAGLCESADDPEELGYPEREDSEEGDYQVEIDDQDCSYYEQASYSEPVEQLHSNDWEDDAQ